MTFAVPPIAARGDTLLVDREMWIWGCHASNPRPLGPKANGHAEARSRPRDPAQVSVG